MKLGDLYTTLSVEDFIKYALLGGEFTEEGTSGTIKYDYNKQRDRFQVGGSRLMGCWRHLTVDDEEAVKKLIEKHDLHPEYAPVLYNPTYTRGFRVSKMPQIGVRRT